MMKSKLKAYKSWLKFVKDTESFFEDAAFLKVRTPKLLKSSAMESSLFCFKVLDEKQQQTWVLPTSPEFPLKKLWLSGEFPKVFEISNSFRANEEVTDFHQPEFSMLEFYWEAVDRETFVTFLFEFLRALGLLKEGQAFKRVKLNEAFTTFTDFNIKPNTTKEELKRVLSFHSQHHSEQMTWNDLYQLIFINLIEPNLSKTEPLILENYPPQLAALAKLNEQGWADRFELYMGGLELGNAYNELFDKAELKKRWDEENHQKAMEENSPHLIDYELLDLTSKSHLESGFGMAIGLERLFYLQQLILGQNPDSIKVWPFD